MKKDILDDKNLESLNIIPQINTLEIINKADEIIKRKEVRRINIVGIMGCVLILIFNLVTLMVGGIKIFAIVQVVALWISPILILPMLKRYCDRRPII